MRVIRRRASKQIANLDRDSVLGLAHELIRGAPFARFVAYELIQNHPAAMRSITVTEVEALGSGIKSWSDVDTFAPSIAGPAWRSGRIPDAAIRRWAKSEDRWWRRAALVSTVPLNAAAGGDPRVIREVSNKLTTGLKNPRKQVTTPAART